ncbi:MAG: hypothetical protein E7553_07145 [Ruminococcaceae bacterium]|nr:hypothetical protein [Oscillospiraceae bacterium]
MKRIVAMVLVLLMLCVPVSAQSVLKYVTDFDYAVIRNGGTDGTFVYGAYENNGEVYKMGLLTEDGEQTRTAWTADGWNALFEPSEWTVTVHGDAGALCPYATTHKDGTLCPYIDVASVTLTHKVTGTALENRYLYYPKKTVTDGSTLNMCFGKYGYKSPETLRWDGVSTRVSLCNAQGLWGVYDVQTDTMLTELVYADMSAVYGDFAKVSDGTAWGRLDLSGKTPTVYSYARAEDFSVTEELRKIGDKQYRVFNADNEPISAVYEMSVTAVAYAPKAHTVLATYTDGTKALLDLLGNTVASFDTLEQVQYLDRACYAVEKNNERGAVIGVALAQMTDVVKPQDTVLVGDVNFDGVCNSADARMILANAMELQTLTERQTLAADVMQDGKLSTADARALLATILE